MHVIERTHEVTNQAPPLVGYDVFEADVPLVEALEREAGGYMRAELSELGRVAGSLEAREHSERCERNEPRLVTHDRFGSRVDRVDLDPSWHWILKRGIEFGLSGGPWSKPEPGAQVARCAGMQVWSQVNSGVMCPISMTYSIIPALREQPELAQEWEPRLTMLDYEAGAIGGMAMTEKQGGSDVRANTTQAEPAGDGWYELTGHKWFCSYPPCDIFLTLAQAPAGLSCFLFEPGPGFELQRLKDKLGTRSLPSSEVEFRALPARLVGEEGRGIPTIIRMVNHTRLDCLVGSATSMRHGVAAAVNHARHRSAFGRPLIEQPLMRNVLCDLAVESEAATTAAMRVARAYDEGDSDFRRFATAVMKYWVCKRAAGHANEALEVFGGNGYVEESGMPRLYRDAPLNSIWEGSGNVAALDVLRAMVKEPEGLPAFMTECRLAGGADRRLDAHLDSVEEAIARFGEGDAQWRARRVVEELAVGFQASLLVRFAPPAVADAFCSSRLGDGGRVYGTLPDGVDADVILDRALAA